eukprot:13102149-Alexandrium_andersonii.AAC.1
MSAHRVLASLGHDPVSHDARARRHSIVRPVAAQHALSYIHLRSSAPRHCTLAICHCYISMCLHTTGKHASCRHSSKVAEAEALSQRQWLAEAGWLRLAV